MASKPVLPATEKLQGLPAAAQTGFMCECAAAGDVEGIRSLKNAGVDANAGTAYDRRTPLHVAAASGNYEVAKVLIDECGATLQRDRFGLLPIHDAVQHGHNEVRNYLQNQKLAPMDATGVACELKSAVFELIVKEGIFSYTTVQVEVDHFFGGLDMHPHYFKRFTAPQIAKHVNCLIGAKRVSQATEDDDRMDFSLNTEETGLFLTTIDCPLPTAAQKRTEKKISQHLTENFASKLPVSLLYLASDGPVFPGRKDRKESLGIFTTEVQVFDSTKNVAGVTSLESLASTSFLEKKSQEAKDQYQKIMEEVVQSRRTVVKVVPGDVYPPPHRAGFVLLFGTADTAGRHYFDEVCQAMRFVGLAADGFCLETFANGVIIYSLWFRDAKEPAVQLLGKTIEQSTLLKNFPGKSEAIFQNVMKSQISHQTGLYLLAAVKFVFVFFPKEQYAPEYVQVHKVLERDQSKQRQLEALYKLCMTELLSTSRIYELVQRHLDLAVKIFEDFKAIATGEVVPRFNQELAAAIDAVCTEQQDRQILRMFLTFNESCLMTNFFKTENPGALAFRLNPQVALKDRPTSLYPEVPYGIYMICGRDFIGFHVRFRDVARGGIRLVRSRDVQSYNRNFATLFDEAYNLSLTQQYKNKDIPEGGAKGVILPDSAWPNAEGGNSLAGESSQSPAAFESCFTRYLNALLDCMLVEDGIYSGNMKGKEILFFGPDENTAGYMDLGAEIAKSRGYPYWKALTTGKSVKLGGVPHDTYGMTTASVHSYAVGLLQKLNIDESQLTKFQTGGPDGDLGSNEILVSKDKTIGIVDGSGVLYDPAGLNREELVRLAKKRVMVKDYNKTLLGKDGFLVLVEEKGVTLPDGATFAHGAELRDTFHLTKYATADLFVPCGGRPNAVNAENVKHFFGADGKPKFKYIVEGANLFFHASAREVLENAGVHVFKDASTNKGGVTSSSLEVLAALALSTEHGKLMCYNPAVDNAPPQFYQQYVKEVVAIIMDNAKQEFEAIWAVNQATGIHKAEATRLLSMKINQITDSVQVAMESMPADKKQQLVKFVLNKALPPLIVSHLGIEGLLANVPANYIAAIVGAWIGSRFVYNHGIDGSEVSFFLFMSSLVDSK